MMTKMSEITIPGYETIVPGQIFTSTDTPFYGAVKTILLSKYKVPTKEELLAKIRMEAQICLRTEEFMSRSILGRYQREQVRELADENSPAIDVLRVYAPIDGLTEGANYFSFYSGMIVPQMLANIDYSSQMPFTEYVNASRDMLLENGNIEIRLEGSGLPSRRLIDYLISIGVRDSHVFSTSHSHENYAYAAEQLDLIYRELEDPESMSQTYDKSDLVCAIRANQTLEANLIAMTRKSRGMAPSADSKTMN